MAKITSLVLLFLTVAAASIPTPAGAGVGAAVFAFAGKAALKRTADVLQKSSKKLMKPIDILKDIAVEAVSQTTDGPDGQMHPRGKDAVAGLVPEAVAVDAVLAGGVSFSVRGVDVTSRVTWTSRCVGGGSPVPCGDPLCEQYGACGGGDASSAAGRVCNSVASAGALLHEGNIILIGRKGPGILIFARDNAAYTCRPNAAAGGYDYAVIGLGRGNDIVAKFKESPFFSYIIDSDLQGSTVWVSNNALLAQRATAEQAGSRSTTRLLSVGSNSSVYYVGITGIKVGSGEVASEEVTSKGILTTTMPFTFIKPSLFDHLKQELRAVASPVNGSGIDAPFRQLCYPNGTKLPAITLLFVGQNAGMELQPEHYSYEDSSGVVCLSILPSPWSSGLSIIGSMVQAGRRMTYKLDDNTLTFDASASTSASASSKPSPSSSSSLTPSFLSPAFAALLLAIIM